MSLCDVASFGEPRSGDFRAQEGGLGAPVSPAQSRGAAKLVLSAKALSLCWLGGGRAAWPLVTDNFSSVSAQSPNSLPG